MRLSGSRGLSSSISCLVVSSLWFSLVHHVTCPCKKLESLNFHLWLFGDYKETPIVLYWTWFDLDTFWIRLSNECFLMSLVLGVRLLDCINKRGEIDFTLPGYMNFCLHLNIDLISCSPPQGQWLLLLSNQTSSCEFNLAIKWFYCIPYKSIISNNSLQAMFCYTPFLGQLRLNHPWPPIIELPYNLHK